MTFVRRHRVTLVLVMLLGVAVALVALRLREQQARAVPRQNREIQVGVVRPERRTLEVTLSFTGDVHPNRQTSIFAKTSGYIRAIHAERGEFVDGDGEEIVRRAFERAAADWEAEHGVEAEAS